VLAAWRLIESSLKSKCRIILYGNTTTGYSLPGKPRLFSRIEAEFTRPIPRVRRSSQAKPQGHVN